MEDKIELMKKWDEFKDNLNEYELTYLERLYIRNVKPSRIDYKEMDIWLFDRWKVTQLTEEEEEKLLVGVNSKYELGEI